VESAEAVAKVEEWLREVHGPDSDLRVDREHVFRRPDGWFVPYNAAAFLDGSDPGAQVVPPPALVVQDPGGELRATAPVPGGLTIPAQHPDRDHWAEEVDPEYANAGFGRLGVPLAAIMSWRRYTPDGTDTGETRPNPEYRTGPARRGYPLPVTPLDSLLEFRTIGWLDQRKFVIGLLEESFLVPLTDGTVQHQWVRDGRRVVEIWTSTRFVPPGCREWLWLDPVTFLDYVPEADLIIHGPWQLPVEVTTEEVRAAHAEFPRFNDKIDVAGHFPEAMPDMTRWAADNAARIGLPEPVPPPFDAADSARAHGFELTTEECYRVVTARSWVRRMAMALPPRPPQDPPAFGLVRGYDDDGNPAWRVDSLGKFADTGQDTNFSWQRILGAYVGFALGEALANTTDQHNPGPVGPLTQRLLFLTEAVLRGGVAAVPEATPRWLHTQGQTVPDIQGWLPTLAELHSVRNPDPADLRSGPAVLLGALPGVLTLGARGEVPFGASEEAVRAFSALPDSTEDDLTYAAFLGLLLERSLDRQFCPALWVSAIPALADREGPQWDAVRDLASRSLIAVPEQGMFSVVEPDSIGDGHDTASVLGRALAAVSGFENNPEVALLRAINHSGRSALTGAIAGALVGARNGVPDLPQKWVHQVELRPLIERVVTDVTRKFEGIPQEAKQRWLRRYPAVRP